MKDQISLDARRVASALLLSTLLSASALAADSKGLYFALTAGEASVDEFDGDINAVVVQSFLDGGADTSVLTGSSLDDSDGMFGVHVGYSFNPYVALEIGYVDLGEANAVTNVNVGIGGTVLAVSADNRFSTSGPTVALVGSFPFAQRFEVHGRGGLFFSDTRVRTRLIDANNNVFDSVSDKSSDSDLFLGVGAGWSISDDYELRVDYQRYLDVGKDAESDVNALSVSFLFR